MSRTGPQALIVVGDTDWWSTQHRHTDMRYDSRLRAASLLTGVGAWRSILSAGTRVPTSIGWYAELVNEAGSPNLMFGVCDDAHSATVISTWIADAANAASMRQTNAANIYLDAAINQTGLGGATAGDVMGLWLYLDSGTPKVQFYKNGVAYGAAVTVTSASFRLGASWTVADLSATLRVDRDDLQFLPEGAAPWGAAARIADAGGYSPSASRWTQNGANVTVDAFGRTASSAVADDSAGAGNAPNLSGGTGIYYYELLIEAIGANRAIGGLAIRTHNHSTVTFIGQSATSWGYYAVDGNKYNNGVGAAYGGAATTGDRMGIFWQPSTGKLWWAKNGVVQGGGDPAAGTGAAYTNAIGDLVPAYSPYTGRVRLCTHAREQLYRPTYAEAWDGADILPEQHYRGRLSSNTEITQGIWFPVPWGGSRRTGSPIGAIEAANQDGAFDALFGWNLRDQAVSLYEFAGERIKPLARGLVETLQFQGETRVRVLTRGVDARLDRRIDQPLFAFGNISVAPVEPVQDQQITYNVCDSAYAVGGSTANDGTGLIISNGGKLEVREKGLLVTTFRRGNVDIVRGFVRTAGVLGKQAVRNLNIRKLSKLVSDYWFRDEFTTWAGDNPAGWTVVETGPTALITQNGNACRFIRNAGAPVASITRALGVVSSSAQLLIDLRVTGYTSGDITVSLIRDSDGLVLATAPMGITGTGRFVGFLIKASTSAANSLRLEAIDTTDLTVDWVEHGRALATDGGGSVPGISPVEYLLVDCGGMTSNDFSYTASNQDITVGYWSNSRPTLRSVLDALMHAWQRDYYTDSEGRLQFVFWEDKIEEATAVAEITEDDIIGTVSVEDDLAPALSDSHASRKNYAVHSETDLVGGVSNAERAILIAENRTVKLDLSLSGGGTGGGASDAYALHPFYQHAVGAQPIESIRTPASESTDPRHPGGVGTYLYRMHRRYPRRRAFYTVSVAASLVEVARPGDALRLTMPRFGLDAGKTLMVVSKSRTVTGPSVKLKLWG